MELTEFLILVILLPSITAIIICFTTLYFHFNGKKRSLITTLATAKNVKVADEAGQLFNPNMLTIEALPRTYSKSKKKEKYSQNQQRQQHLSGTSLCLERNSLKLFQPPPSSLTIPKTPDCMMISGADLTDIQDFILPQASPNSTRLSFSTTRSVRRVSLLIAELQLPTPNNDALLNTINELECYLV